MHRALKNQHRTHHDSTMRITDPLKASLIAMAISAANPCLAEDYSESLEIPGSEWRIESQCSAVADATQCTISVNDGKTEEKVLDYPAPPASANYEANIFLLTFGCGTACSVAYVYKLGGHLGGPFPLVEATDNEREVVMSLGAKSVLFYRMFDNNDALLHEITPELNDANLLDVVDDSSLENHIFRLSYRTEHGLEELQYEAPQ